MSKRFMYLLEKIRDGTDYPKGIRIWTDHKCTGWRVVKIIQFK